MYQATAHGFDTNVVGLYGLFHQNLMNYLLLIRLYSGYYKNMFFAAILLRGEIL